MQFTRTVSWQPAMGHGAPACRRCLQAALWATARCEGSAAVRPEHGHGLPRACALLRLRPQPHYTPPHTHTTPPHTHPSPPHHHNPYPLQRQRQREEELQLREGRKGGAGWGEGAAAEGGTAAGGGGEEGGEAAGKAGGAAGEEGAQKSKEELEKSKEKLKVGPIPFGSVCPTCGCTRTTQGVNALRFFCGWLAAGACDQWVVLL